MIITIIINWIIRIITFFLIPNILIRSMENMSTILMNLNSFLFTSIDITRDMISFFNDFYFFPFKAASWAKTAPKRPAQQQDNRTSYAPLEFIVYFFYQTRKSFYCLSYFLFVKFFQGILPSWNDKSSSFSFSQTHC